MSIVSHLQRLQLAKEDIITLLEKYGEEFPNGVSIEDIPPMLVSMPKIETPYAENYEYGWVNGQGYNSTATWTYQQPNGGMSDIYRLKANHKYTCWICQPGTRFRVMWCTTDPTSVAGNVSGKGIIRKDNPPAGTTWSITGATPSHIFTPTSDCYLIVQKDNTYNSNIKTYLLDFTYFENPPTPTWATGE